MNVKLDYINLPSDRLVDKMESPISSELTPSPVSSVDTSKYDVLNTSDQSRQRNVTINGIISVNNEDHSLTSPLVENELTEIISSSCADESKLQGIVFLEDAFQYRSIHHKTSTFCLNLYRWYHSAPIRFSVSVATFLILMLPFFEDPTSLSWSSDPRRLYSRFTFPDGYTEGIELVCLFILAFSGIVQGYLSTYGKKTQLSFIKSNPWLAGGYLVLILSFIDIIISLVLGNQVYRIRVRRLFRPYFLAQNTRMLKKTLKAMWNTVPEIISVLTLLSLHLYFFTMLGMLVFHKKEVNGTSSHTDGVFNNTEWKLYFSSLDTAIMSLLVLLTTANNPDVMMPSYSENRLYAIYFIVFSLFGTFLIFNLLTAIIYNQFRGYFKCSMQTSYFRRCVALNAAHCALAKIDMVEDTSRAPRVSVMVVKEAIENVRITPDQRNLILAAIRNIDSEEVDLDLTDFCHIFDDMDSVCRTLLPRKNIPIWSSRTMKRIQRIVLSRYFNIAGILVVLLNAVLMTIEIAIHYEEAFQAVFSRLNIMNYIFVAYYFIEQILKIFSLGQRYFVDINCLYDGTITVALVCLEVVQLVEFGGSPRPISYGYGLSLWDCARFVNILVLLRLLRIIPNIKPMALVTGVTLEIIRSLKSFAGIIIIIYYVFAILGMMLFENSIAPPSGNATTAYECGSYEQLQYWANNFDDFAASLVILWDVMVVNNWGVFLQAFKKEVNPWSQLFFVAWWLISSVVCINLFVALILDHFIAKWEGNKDEETTTRRGTIQSLFRKHLQEPSQERIQEELRKHPCLCTVFTDSI